MAITSRALAFASRWFAPTVVDRVFEPLIADWQREWQDAPRGRRFGVKIRGLFAFVCAVLVSSPDVVRTAVPKSVSDRVVTSIARVTFLMSAVLTIPFLLEMAPDWRRGVLPLLIIPSSLVLAFPFAMIGAVDAIRRSEPLPKHVERAMAVKLGLVAVLLAFVFGGWVVPTANQAWRVAMAQHSAGRSGTPPRGLRELTFYELAMDPSRAAAREPGTWAGARADSIRRELSSRASLTVLPVLLLWRRWRALDLPPGRWYSPRSASIATLTVIFGYLFLRYNDRFVEAAWHLPPGTGPWLPLIIMATIGAIRTGKSAPTTSS